jgi:L,D-transpeptidase ErfK/SrfK
MSSNLVKIALFLVSVLLMAPELAAGTYPLAPDVELVGEERITRSRESDTLMDIARAYKLGHQDIRMANPDVDIWLPGEGTRIVIPTRFVLPDAPREGMVLNRSEMRLYYYHADPEAGAPLVTTYPVGIGRVDRQTPTGRGHVIMKLEDPAWYPTENVRADYASRGKKLPHMIPPGPDNPLGKYAIMLDIPGYLIHGTNRPDGIGMRVSQGCVRLYPEDIEALIHKVPKGTPFTIVDQPYKVGIQDGELLIEVHPVVYPEGDRQGVSEEQKLINRIVAVLDQRGDELKYPVDWERVTGAFRRANGMPAVVAGP